MSGVRADLVLRRPDVLNAMDFDVFDGLSDAADRLAAAADDLRVVVVSGEGRAFSSGIDIGALGTMGGQMDEMVDRAQAGFRKLAALPLATVAKIHGYAFGAGLQLALSCDLRVAAHGAKLGLLEANYGLIPDLIGSTRLPQLVGAGRAKRMIWLAEKLDTEAAERIGLIEFAVEASELDATVDALAEDLAQVSPTVIRESKALIEAAHARTISDGMDAEKEAQMRCMTAPGFADALMAGVQKVGARRR